MELRHCRRTSERYFLTLCGRGIAFWVGGGVVPLPCPSLCLLSPRAPAPVACMVLSCGGMPVPRVQAGTAALLCGPLSPLSSRSFGYCSRCYWLLLPLAAAFPHRLEFLRIPAVQVLGVQVGGYSRSLHTVMTGATLPHFSLQISTAAMANMLGFHPPI